MPRPSTCDIVVVIIWGRMGTELPARIVRSVPVPSLVATEWEKRYLSGTEWEYEDAAHANPVPDILVYRREPWPSHTLDDQFTATQIRRVKLFLRRFNSSSGGSLKSYTDPKILDGYLRNDLSSLIRRRLDDRSVKTSGSNDSSSDPVNQLRLLVPFADNTARASSGVGFRVEHRKEIDFATWSSLFTYVHTKEALQRLLNTSPSMKEFELRP